VDLRRASCRCLFGRVYSRALQERFESGFPSEKALLHFNAPGLYIDRDLERVTYRGSARLLFHAALKCDSRHRSRDFRLGEPPRGFDSRPEKEIGAATSFLTSERASGRVCTFFRGRERAVPWAYACAHARVYECTRNKEPLSLSFSLPARQGTARSRSHKYPNAPPPSPAATIARI